MRWFRSCHAVAAIALALAMSDMSAAASERLIPPSVLPGLDASATRTVVDPNSPPWSGVVRVQTEVGIRCTGALIGARRVLTAAHCLFGRGTGRLVRPGSVHVLLGYDHGAYLAHARALSIEIGPGFGLDDAQRKLPATSPGADWAVLTLDTAVGTTERILPLWRTLPDVGTPVALGGYEQDRAQVILADTDCHIVAVDRLGDGAALLRHSCAGTRGVSGGPLLARAPNGQWAVVGVASVAEVRATGGYAVAVAPFEPEDDTVPRAHLLRQPS